MSIALAQAIWGRLCSADMRTLAVTFTAAGQRTWVVDKDCVLTAMQSSGGNVMLSEDPTVANPTVVATPTSAVEIFSWFTYCVSNQISPQLQIPLFEGRTLYIVSSQATTAFIYLEDISAE